MATVKDVEDAVSDLDVRVKVVLDPNVTMYVTSDREIVIGKDFLEELSKTELDFAIKHEYAHLELNHFERKVLGEEQLDLEYEADKFAIASLQKEGQQTCNQLDDIEELRPFWDTTHPSSSSLRQMSCETHKDKS